MISVIIPTKNEEKLLPRLLGQFSPELRAEFDLQLIVSDGGSTDATLDLARAYNAQLTVEANQKTIARGRNQGAALAKGEILVFLDADSLIVEPQNFFKNIYQAFADKSLAAMSVNVKLSPDEFNWQDIFGQFCLRLLCWFDDLRGRGVGRGNCQIIRLDCFKKVGGYNEALVAGEDFELYQRLHKLGKFYYAKNMVIYESARRFRRWGYIKTFFFWYRNYRAVIKGGLSWSKVWERVE